MEVYHETSEKSDVLEISMIECIPGIRYPGPRCENGHRIGECDPDSIGAESYCGCDEFCQKNSRPGAH
jgi:hypothetical protein